MQRPNPISLGEFEDLIRSLRLDLSRVHKVAVAVSGGQDSMALSYLLSQYAKRLGDWEVHALTVDHGLREDSAREAHAVGDSLSGWPHVRHQILTWENPSQNAIQEQARFARYDEMNAYCEQHEIKYLFLGHHLDDQAETFLFRLAKGSGLDGLSSMRPMQPYKSIQLTRPFLAIEKERLLETCQKYDITFIDDPSNQNDEFARVRLRQAREVLETEGLSSKRLGQTAHRLSRARDALEKMANNAYQEYMAHSDDNDMSFNWSGLKSEHEEIIHRVLWMALMRLSENNKYGPRLLKFEDLVTDLLSSEGDFKRTLGGVIWQCKDGGVSLILQKEVKS